MVPLNGQPSSIAWFTEGEFAWRTGASIAWIVICLPLTMFMFHVAQLLDAFHPIAWITGVLQVPFQGSFWLAVFVCGVTAVATSLSRAKFSSVKDVIHKTRIATILFPLQPARVFHIMLFTMSGLLIMWSLASQPFGSLSIYNPESNSHHLNEYLVFLLLYGAWLGFYHSLSFFCEKKFHFGFPEIQENKFFRTKFAVVPCIKQSIVISLRACRWYYPLYYLAGNIPRDCIANSFGIPVNRSTTQLNSICGLFSLPLLWFLLTSGTFVIFMWEFGNRLFVIFNTQAYTFPVETAFAAEKEQCLPEIIKNRTVPLLKYLAFLDLFQLSQFNSLRRKQLFSLSQPGGRSVNWSNVSEECMFVVDFLTTNLTEFVARKAQLQQLKQEPAFLSPQRNGGTGPRKDSGFPQTSLLSGNKTVKSPIGSSMGTNTPYIAGYSGPASRTSLLSPAGYSGTANGTYTSSPAGYTTVSRRHVISSGVQLWSASPGRSQAYAPSPVQPVTPRQKIMAKLDPYIWRVQQVPHNMAVALKKRPIIGYLFNEIPESSTRVLFADCQLQIWAVEALSRLVAASFTEDTFGVVQKTLPDVLTSLLSLLMALDRHFKFPVANSGKPVIHSRPPRPQGKDGMPFALRAALVSSIFRITTTFRDHLSLVKLEPEHRNRLQSFMDFME